MPPDVVATKKFGWFWICSVVRVVVPVTFGAEKDSSSSSRPMKSTVMVATPSAP